MGVRPHEGESSGLPDRAAMVEKWLRESSWPTPKWYSTKQPPRLGSYEHYVTYELRARYVDVENDFRSVMGNYPDSHLIDYVTAARVVAMLHQARAALEEESPDLLTVSTVLDSLESYMVWVYPPHVLRSRATAVLANLESRKIPVGISLLDELRQLIARGVEALYSDQYAFGTLRSVLGEAIDQRNRHLIQERIGTGLQLARLGLYRNWTIGVLVGFMLVAPLTANVSSLEEWPAQAILGADAGRFTPWLNALSVAFVGAIAGFLSSLLQARTSRVVVAQYQENVVDLQLKPMLGALISLVVFVMLSWNVLPGIRIENAGSYFFLAFLSGFSERYFLRLFKIDEPTERPAGGASEPANSEPKPKSEKPLVAPHKRVSKPPSR